MSQLLQFLKETAGNPDALKAFQQDPETAMQAAGLSDAEKKAVKSGDRAEIAKLVEAGGAHAEGAFLNVTVQLIIQVS